MDNLFAVYGSTNIVKPCFESIKNGVWEYNYDSEKHHYASYSTDNLTWSDPIGLTISGIEDKVKDVVSTLNDMIDKADAVIKGDCVSSSQKQLDGFSDSYTSALGSVCGIGSISNPSVKVINASNPSCECEKDSNLFRVYLDDNNSIDIKASHIRNSVGGGEYIEFFLDKVYVASVPKEFVVVKVQ